MVDCGDRDRSGGLHDNFPPRRGPPWGDHLRHRSGQVEDATKHRVQPDPYHAGQNLVEQVSGGEWVEKAPYFEAIAVNGDGVFDTLKAVSKLVLKALA